MEKINDIKKYLYELKRYSDDQNKRSGRYKVDWANAARRCPVTTNKELMEKINTNNPLTICQIMRLVLLDCDYKIAKRYYNCNKNQFNTSATKYIKEKYLNKLSLLINFSEKLNYVINTIDDKDIVDAINETIADTSSANTQDTDNSDIKSITEIVGCLDVEDSNENEYIDKKEQSIDENDVVDSKPIESTKTQSDVSIIKGDELVVINDKPSQLTLNDVKYLISINDTYIDIRKAVLLKEIIAKIINRQINVYNTEV